jgi:hypothetical protein
VTAATKLPFVLPAIDFVGIIVERWSCSHHV